MPKRVIYLFLVAIMFPLLCFSVSAAVLNDTPRFTVGDIGKVLEKSDELDAHIPGLMGFYIDAKTGRLVLDVFFGTGRGAAPFQIGTTARLAEEITGIPSTVNALPGPLQELPAVTMMPLAEHVCGFLKLSPDSKGLSGSSG